MEFVFESRKTWFNILVPTNLILVKLLNTSKLNTKFMNKELSTLMIFFQGIIDEYLHFFMTYDMFGTT
jgi:hypothetical protein